MNDKSRDLGLLPHKTRTSAPRKSVSYVVPAKEIAINQDLPKTLAELIGSVLSEGSEVHVIVKCTEGEAKIEFIGSEEQIVLAERVMTNLSNRLIAWNLSDASSLLWVFTHNCFYLFVRFPKN